MKLYDYLLLTILAIAAPAHALLGAKIALLGVLKHSLDGSSNEIGYGNGNGYGNGGYVHGVNYNRPVYTGQHSNYGWGQQTYGGAYVGGHIARYNGGNEEPVKLIKVIISREQPQNVYDSYAKSSSAAALLTASGVSWTPIPAPIPVVQTYAPQSTPVQIAGNVKIPISAQTPIQVIQSPPRPVYVQAQPQPQYIQGPQARPIHQPIYQLPQILPPVQQTVKTVRVIVDRGSQSAPAPAYAPPPPDSTYVTPGANNAAVFNANSWSSSSSGNGWSNIGTEPQKSAGC